MTTSAPKSGSRGPLLRRPDLDSVYSINPDGSRNFLQPTDVHGRWQTRKKLVWAILIAVYAVIPWIEIGGHPAILFDIPHRSAYLFGFTFTRDDFYLVFFLLTGIGFTLFAITALFGRVWCGYACPQTVFLEGIARRIERWIEGSRAERVRRNKGPWNFDKTWRKAAKISAFAALSLLVAHIFLAYFIPARELWHVTTSSPSAHPFAFGFTMALAGILFFDFAWFREQLCIVICPYGRLQSALIDDDTVIIGYDQRRGEPRAKPAKGAAAAGKGDCIDCMNCVAACPTGIDIRNGLQLECVGCMNCIDACDDVMRKIGKPEGLVRYDSKNAFEGKPRRFVRPRIFFYAALGLVGLTVFLVTASGRNSFEATQRRARGLPYVLAEGTLRNVLTVHVRNKTDQTQRYTLKAALPQGSPGPSFAYELAETEISLQALASTDVALTATLSRDEYKGRFPIVVTVTGKDGAETVDVELQFIGP
jgi:cytochrome c oxidase accessory protein FixG